jgi:hypothetical protein
MSQGNRRIDRVLAADYLDGLAALSMDEVRTLRKDAEQEETDLSYVRRLLQGRLDILRAEHGRRSGAGDESLVDSLAKILADDNAGSPRGLGRHISAEPSRTDSHRRQVEALVADLDISDPGALDEAALDRALEVLESEERSVSEKRRAVQQVMDACTAEIARRYRDGDANVSDLLPTSG